MTSGGGGTPAFEEGLCCGLGWEWPESKSAADAGTALAGSRAMAEVDTVYWDKPSAQWDSSLFVSISSCDTDKNCNLHVFPTRYAKHVIYNVTN